MLNKLGRSLLSVGVGVGLMMAAGPTLAGYGSGGHGGHGYHHGWGQKCKWVGGHWRNGHWVRPHRVCWGQGHRGGGHHCYWVKGHWGYAGWVPGRRVCR